MATVIDTLIVELGLDPTKFTKGQKDAAEALRRFQQEAQKTSNEVESAQKKQSNIFATMKMAVAGLAAGFGAREIFNFVAGVYRADAAVSRLGHTMNVVPRTLDVWKNVMLQVGGSTESATAAFGALSADINDFLAGRGGGQFQELFAALNISLRKANDELKTMDEFFLEITSKLAARVNDPAQRAAFLRTLPGMNQDMINAIVKGREVLDELIASGERMSNVNRNSAQTAEEYGAALGKLAAAWDYLKRAMVTTAAATITTDPTSGKGLVDWMMTGLKFDVLPNSIADKVLRAITLRADGTHLFPGLFQKLGAGAGPGPAAPTPAPVSSVPSIGMTRADRNNNPGNIEYGPFARRNGATGSDGRFAIFPDREAGFRAAEALMMGAGYRNLTLAQIGARWAEGDPNWARNASRATGLPTDRVLTDEERRRVARLGTVAAEGSRLGPGVGGLAGAAGGSTTITNTTNINAINVSVPGGDADAIADKLGGAMRKNNAAAAANMGQG